MRLDFWLCGWGLLGMGFLEQEDHCHDGLFIAASINSSVRVSLDGEWKEASFILMDSRVNYSMEKKDDWQLFAYIHEGTRLADLLRKKLAGNPYLLYQRPREPQDWLTPYISDHYQDYQAEELFLQLLKHNLGVDSYPLDWNPDLQAFFRELRHGDWEERSLQGLADSLGLSGKEMKENFFRITGIPLDIYLVHMRLAETFSRIQRGWELEKACRHAGLASYTTAQVYFQMSFGLDLEWILKEMPTLRFFPVDFTRLYAYSENPSSSSS